MAVSGQQPGKTRYPLYRGLSGPQGRSGQVRKISPPPVFDSRTVQPVAYNDYAIPPEDFITLKTPLEVPFKQTNTVRYSTKLRAHLFLEFGRQEYGCYAGWVHKTLRSRTLHSDTSANK